MISELRVHLIMTQANGGIIKNWLCASICWRNFSHPALPAVLQVDVSKADLKFGVQSLRLGGFFPKNLI